MRCATASLGGWELNTINTANTGMPLDVIYTPAAANDVTGPHPGLPRRRRSCGRMWSGDPTGPSGPAMLDHYFNKAAFAIPVGQRAVRQSWDATRSARRASGSGTSA